MSPQYLARAIGASLLPLFHPPPLSLSFWQAASLIPAAQESQFCECSVPLLPVEEIGCGHWFYVYDLRMHLDSASPAISNTFSGITL